MQIVDAQIHVWGSGLPSNLAHRQVTAFTTEEAIGLMDAGGVDAAVIHPAVPPPTMTTDRTGADWASGRGIFQKHSICRDDCIGGLPQGCEYVCRPQELATSTDAVLLGLGKTPPTQTWNPQAGFILDLRR